MAFYRVAIYYRIDYGAGKKGKRKKKPGKGQAMVHSKSYEHLKLLYGFFNKIIVKKLMR